MSTTSCTMASSSLARTEQEMKHTIVDDKALLAQSTDTPSLCAPSWDLRKDEVSRLRHLVEPAHVHLCLWRKLVRFRPLSNRRKISASMLRVEVDKRRWVWLSVSLPPHLTKHPDTERGCTKSVHVSHAVRIGILTLDCTAEPASGYPGSVSCVSAQCTRC